MAEVSENLPEKENLTKNDEESVKNGVDHQNNGASDTEKKENPTPEVTEALKKKILDQVHYYFGDYNLPRDKFLREEIKKDDGWIDMATLLNFKRLASLSKDEKIIMSALEPSNLIEVEESKKQIRRSPLCPLPELGEDLRTETTKRTIYLKGFPKDGSISLDVLLEFFKPYGPFESIHMRHFFDKERKKQGFKGSVLVVFPTEDKAKELYDIDDLKYKNMPLLTKWHANYLEEKKTEIQERITRKEERNKKRQQEMEEQEQSKGEFPKGVFVHISGVPSGSRREDIKESLNKHSVDIAFIDFSQGDTEGYFRLSTPNSNEAFIKEFEGKVQVKEANVSLRIVEGTEEEEQIKKALEARHRSTGPKKRRGGPGGYHHFKKKRFN